MASNRGHKQRHNQFCKVSTLFFGLRGASFQQGKEFFLNFFCYAARLQMRVGDQNQSLPMMVTYYYGRGSGEREARKTFED